MGDQRYAGQYGAAGQGLRELAVRFKVGWSVSKTNVSFRAWTGPSTAISQRLSWVESVSSLVQEAAVELLDAAIVSCPPYCRRRTRPVPMAAKAEHEPNNSGAVRPLHSFTGRSNHEARPAATGSVSDSRRRPSPRVISQTAPAIFHLPGTDFTFCGTRQPHFLRLARFHQ